LNLPSETDCEYIIIIKNIIIVRVSITRWNSVVVIMLYLYRMRITMPLMSSLPRALCTLTKCSIDKIALRSKYNIMTWVSPWFYNRVVYIIMIVDLFWALHKIRYISNYRSIIILLWYNIIIIIAPPDS